MLDFLKKIMLARELKAPASGTVFPMDQVADDVFSSCMLGGGVAIHPSGGMLVGFDKALIEARGCCCDILLVVLDSPRLPKLTYRTGMEAVVGKTVVAAW